MRSSVIYRMYTGFILIIILFAITVAIMLKGMNDIHGKFESVSKTSLPLVALSNQTSEQLLYADKSFKDFLTTENQERMNIRRQNFFDSQEQFLLTLAELEAASAVYPALAQPYATILEIEQRYFGEAKQAMSDYQQMFTAQEAVQKSSREFQKSYNELSVNMKEYIADKSTISSKFLAKTYFIKLGEIELLISDALASNDPEFVKRAVERNKKIAPELNNAYASLAKAIPGLNDAFGDSVTQFSSEIKPGSGALDLHSNYLNARTSLYNKIASLATMIDQTLLVFQDFNRIVDDRLQHSLDEAGSIYASGITKALIIAGIVIFFAAAIGYHIAHSVRTPLTRILDVLESLTKGDMTQRIELQSNNEFSRVSSHINTLADNLHSILVKLSHASAALATTACENEETSSQGRMQLDAQRDQTAALATAATEVSQSVQEIARSAKGSLDMVQRVETASNEGRTIMSTNISTINQLGIRLNDSVNTVNELQQRSEQIGSILDVIRNIAEQTNLLALNAAIEAARAGEQGRGFAVVADEVRVLASKTSQSTSTIESMIGELQASSLAVNEVIKSCMHDMEISVTQASTANNTMEEIQSMILQISDMSTHISQATVEQSATAEEIASSIEYINKVTEQSYQAMSEIAESSESLTRLVGQQNELVGQFKL